MLDDIAEEFEQAEPWEHIAEQLYTLRKLEHARGNELKAKKRDVHATHCPGCLKPFDPRATGLLRKFCARACSVRFHNNIAKEKRCARRSSQQQ